jgi:tetratricopeptide (TPR) repeat protein
MRSVFLVLLIGCAVGSWAQASPASSPSAPANSQPQEPNSAPDHAEKPRNPNLTPPHSDRVNADSFEPGESSSKDSQIDLTPPADDDKVHPQSSATLDDSDANGLNEFHPWDPHRAAKDVEVGDFYFKRKNYRAAEDRYREALLYKNNDAVATFRLAICLEKLDRPDEARQQYEAYLKVLPSGPESEQVKKALARLKSTAANSKPAKQ